MTFMNKSYIVAFLMGVLALASSCSSRSEHFITDNAYRQEVENALQARRVQLPNSALFDILETSMSTAEKEAMNFLYAYMPTADIADYPGSFFLENVRTSFLAQKEMPWGAVIPEEVFRHFVLPVRVNNENLDNSRMVFYQELKDRVKGLSLHDAVIEVNHWCHEKVIYTPSDARTSSPLASVKTAYGRCGEESTFTVAALRSVGIPARQVYTPRWAHTDDNHAWVEAWVDGKWYFLGACEPEPVLNLGWFNAPASRGMLMHTKVFGKYNGQEEIMVQTPLYTEINIIDNYGSSAKATVTVTDANGQPVKDAYVEFKIYNYAEFHTVAAKQTNEQGQTWLSAGLGDMLVWASKDGRFGYGKLSFGKDEHISICLNKTGEEAVTEDLDIVPPPEKANLPEVTEAQRAENTLRMAQEDSIRNAYVATFVNEEKGQLFAKAQGLDPAVVARLLVKSRGNWQVLEDFLTTTPSGQKATALQLLQEISAKDLRDVSAEVLQDHRDHSSNPLDADDDTFNKYILNPRVSNEMITPYKSFFRQEVAEADAEAFVADPMKVVEWVKANIRVDDDCNLGGAPIRPAGVWKTRVADPHSRNIFFVSLCRSLGIAARIDEVTGKVQLMNGKQPADIDFEASEQVSAPQGTLVARFSPIRSLTDPKYYSHFTLSKIENGYMKLLSYDEGDVDMGGGATWSNLLKKGTQLDEGNYLLATGTRMANGSVLNRMVFFRIEGGKTTTVDLVMRESKDDVQVIGSFNSENKYFTTAGEETSLLATTGRGYYIVAILGVRQEPTNHALRDIAAVKEKLEEWGRPMVLLFPDEASYGKFDAHEFGELPGTISYGIDKSHAIQKEMVTAMKLAHANTLPIFLIADTFNRVVFVSQGYTIGLGEQLMQIIHKL